MKGREIHVERDGIVHILKVDDRGVPQNGRKFVDKDEFEKKSPLVEWQFYLMLFVYFIFHTIVRASLLSGSSVMGILHFALVWQTYQEIWLYNKSITWNKLLKTFLWLVIGNIAILAIRLIIGAILDI